MKVPQGLFLSVCVDDITKPGGKQNMVPMWKKLMKLVDLDEPTSFLIMYIWDALNVTAEKCSKHEFLLELSRSIEFSSHASHVKSRLNLVCFSCVVR